MPAAMRYRATRAELSAAAKHQLRRFLLLNSSEAPQIHSVLLLRSE